MRGRCFSTLTHSDSANGSSRLKWPMPLKVKPLSPLSWAAFPACPGTAAGDSTATPGRLGSMAFAAPSSKG